MYKLSDEICANMAMIRLTTTDNERLAIAMETLTLFTDKLEKMDRALQAQENMIKAIVDKHVPDNFEKAVWLDFNFRNHID